jgi:hypothetical protein
MEEKMGIVGLSIKYDLDNKSFDLISNLASEGCDLKTIKEMLKLTANSKYLKIISKILLRTSYNIKDIKKILEYINIDDLNKLVESKIGLRVKDIIKWITSGFDIDDIIYFNKKNVNFTDALANKHLR